MSTTLMYCKCCSLSKKSYFDVGVKLLTLQVKIEQGIQVLKTFKSHVSKTSILDDFEFYEARQKALQDKKAKRLQFQKQVRISLLCQRVFL